MPGMILVTGATGTVSSGIISILAAAGHRVAALVRDEAKARRMLPAGVELRVGDLQQPWTLGAVFEGVDTAWLLSPPVPRAPEQASNALWAARAAGVKRVVRMSAIGAAHDAPAINARLHALSDVELAASGLDWSIIRPQFFMQNLLASAPTVAAAGTLYLPLGAARVGMIDAADVSAFAARVLTTPGHSGKIYRPTGPAAVTMHEVAEAIGAALGKTVHYQPVSLEAARGAMLEAGVDAWTANLVCDYHAAFAEGWGDVATGDFEDIVGRPARAFADFARDWPATARA